eukprot:5147368-Pleurochrysis_carterae.AAC.1
MDCEQEYAEDHLSRRASGKQASGVVVGRFSAAAVVLVLYFPVLFRSARICPSKASHFVRGARRRLRRGGVLEDVRAPGWARRGRYLRVRRMRRSVLRMQRARFG